MDKYEATAQRLVDDLLERCEWDEDKYRLTYQSIDVENIAAAIRAAVQEAYERAAKVCDLHAEHCLKWMNEGEGEGEDWNTRYSTSTYLAANIRELEGKP